MQFISECDRQLQMKPQIHDQLKKLNVTDDKELTLEYFFYTNAADKAAQLVEEIKKLNYTMHHGVSAGDK